MIKESKIKRLTVNGHYIPLLNALGEILEKTGAGAKYDGSEESEMRTLMAFEVAFDDNDGNAL